MSEQTQKEHIEQRGVIRRISLPGSTLKRGERVNVFYVDVAGGVLIDVGWKTDDSFEFLRDSLPKPPRHILVTHLHPDHSGGLERVLEWSGANAYAPREDAGVVDQTLPAQVHAYDGEAPIDLNGERFHVLHTPGHTPGHRCFLHESSGALFTGDMVLGEGSTWVGPPHGDMADYMRSLERLREAGHRILCPGHGTIQLDPIAPIERFLAHRREREKQVLEALSEGYTTPKDIVMRNYQETPAYLHQLAEIVVVAHLDKLLQENRVRFEGESYALA